MLSIIFRELGNNNSAKTRASSSIVGGETPSLLTEIFKKFTVSVQPVPKAFMRASFAANLAAKHS
jgi:hypothetical protein